MCFSQICFPISMVRLVISPSQMCMFEQSGKQLAGLWLTFLTDQPLVSLMNCSVSEWLIRPFLQVSVVHIGGLFVEQKARHSFCLQHVRVSQSCVSFFVWTP